MDFPGRNTGIGSPFPHLESLPNPVIEPASPALASRFFITEPSWKQQTLSLNICYACRGPKCMITCPAWLQIQLLFNVSSGGFPGGSDCKVSAYNAGDLGSVPGLARSPGEGNGNSLQFSYLENPMDGGTWSTTVHGVTKSQTRLSHFTFFL